MREIDIFKGRRLVRSEENGPLVACQFDDQIVECLKAVHYQLLLIRIIHAGHVQHFDLPNVVRIILQNGLLDVVLHLDKHAFLHLL